MSYNIHGGDVYNNKVNMDFSVSINPCRIPASVTIALSDAIKDIGKYPDYSNAEIREAIAGLHGVDLSYILPGNGSSELFMAVAHAFKPKKAVLLAPSFYGYMHALNAVGAEIIYSKMNLKGMAFSIDDSFPDLIKNAELAILGNPNNPTGKLIDSNLLKRIVLSAKENDTLLVLDECFMDFCEENASLIKDIEQYKNLIIIRSFTKNFSIPGVRAGYLACSDITKIQRIKEQLPEWNISTFAANAINACCKEEEYLTESRKVISGERKYLTVSLKNLGIKVFESDANFILIYSEKPLYEELLKQGILIRDCSYFEGLSKGYYRISVKSREENRLLTDAVEKVIKQRIY